MEREQWLRELWALHGTTLHLTAMRLTRYHEADAKDLVQECLVRAWSHRESLREPKAARSWLISILKNIFLDGIRKKVKEPVDPNRPEIPDDVPQEEVESDPPWSQVTKEDLQTALAELEPEFRLAFELFEFKGCSYKEIAQQTGATPGTVATRLYRARQKLKELLSKLKQR